ncbi:MAG TPA: histidine kinase [Gaiellaceae bacterium]|nr:histidine kinase [Gaiellaceae bacterium]
MDTYAAGPGSRPRRAGRAQRLAVDLTIALVVFAFSLVLLSNMGEEGDRALDAPGVLLAGLAAFPLVFRRRFPLGVFVVTASATVVLGASGYPPGPPLGPTLALFFLGLHPAETRGGRRLTAAVVVLFYLLHFGAVTIGSDGDGPGVAPLLGILLWGGAWVIGDRFRLRRERMEALAERARRAEQDAEREGRLAVAEERMRIARDLHDSAGHAINVILVQAGAARLHADGDPERARAALTTIEDVARETVTEIDRLVGSLREDGAADTAEHAVDPPLTLAAVAALVEQHRANGLDVELRVDGQQRPLPRAVDGAAYRILQEALTNAAKHGGASARVEILYGPGALTLVVTNPSGRGGVDGPAGHGLVGMRERALLLGGSLAVERDDGTFLVRAELPYGATER